MAGLLYSFTPHDVPMHSLWKERLPTGFHRSPFVMTIADSMSQSVQQLSTRTEKRLLLSCKESALDTGVSFLRNKEIIVFKDAKGAVKATRNSCKHEMGHFNSASGCRAICPRHGWRLDLSTMTYVNPAGGLKQEELIIERS